MDGLVGEDRARVQPEAGTDADLLVVGSRGLGGFSRLLIGSVSSQVAHHAPCPIVVVPTRSQAGGEV
ncbi:MAG: universal stress protein [Acidimicrobiales bacterium]